MDRQCSPHAAGGCLAASPRFAYLAIFVFHGLGCRAGDRVSCLVRCHLSLSALLHAEAFSLVELVVACGLCIVMVAHAAADCCWPRPRGIICGLLELPIPAVGARTSGLFAAGRLAGTYL